MELIIAVLVWLFLGVSGSIFLLCSDIEEWKDGVSILDMSALVLFSMTGFLAFIVGVLTFTRKGKFQSDPVVSFLTSPKFKLPWKKRNERKTDI